MKGYQDKRYLWQEECLQAWVENDCRGIVKAATGSGKTYLALKTIQYLKEHIKRQIRVKVVVPTQALQQQWRKCLGNIAGALEIGSFKTNKKHHADKPYMIYIINSARYNLARCILEELSNGELVFLIADECHHYISAENRKIFEFLPYISSVSGQYCALGLSATLEGAEYDSVLVPALGQYIFNYSYEKALCNRTVLPFAVCQIGVHFFRDEWEQYQELSEHMRYARGLLLKRYPYLRHAGKEFFILLGEIEKSSDPKARDLARTYRYLAYQRKLLVCMARSRIDCVCKLVEKLPRTQQCIIFGESIEQAETLYVRLREKQNCKVGRYHSNMGGQANYNTLMRFRDKETQILIACRALDEGLDVPQVSMGIVMSGTSMERQRLQRLGRIVRYTEDRQKAYLYYLHILGSSEEKTYLSMRGDGFTMENWEYYEGQYWRV